MRTNLARIFFFFSKMAIRICLIVSSKKARAVSSPSFRAPLPSWLTSGLDVPSSTMGCAAEHVERLNVKIYVYIAYSHCHKSCHPLFSTCFHDTLTLKPIYCKSSNFGGDLLLAKGPVTPKLKSAKFKSQYSEENNKIMIERLCH